MRITFLLSFFILMGTAFAQNLPSVIPPSPEVGKIANAYNFSASMYTGAASVSVPLYTVKVGSISMPLALTYTSNGVKVNDIASRVGLGWALIAGGSVSKVIHDEDDDDPVTTRLTDPNFFVPSDAIVDFVKQNAMEGYDSEYDEYSYNAGGISGRFFIDDIGTIRLASKSDHKIEKGVGSDAFKITTGEGIKYYFSAFVKEETRDVKANGIARIKLKKTTAWFLTKIEGASDEVVYLHYNSINTKAFLGPNQSVILKKSFPAYTAGQYNCGACAEGNLQSPNINSIQYATYYLTDITCSNGLSIYFNYEARPQPETGNDNRLKKISVYSQSSNAFIKKYAFEYQDYFIFNDINQRFYLKKIHEIATDYPVSEDLVHTFDYTEPGSLPSQRSFNQDYYGYANAANNVLNFFPKLPNFNEYVYGSFGADRTPNFETTQRGILNKVTFPTGGTQTFEYEPHSKTTAQANSTFTIDNTSMQFIAGVNLYNPPTIVNRIFYLTASEIEFNYLTDVNPVGPSPGTSGFYNPDNVHHLSHLYIYDVETNTIVFEHAHYYRGTNTFNISLPPNKNYKFVIFAYSSSHAVSVWVKYNPVTTTSYVNTNGCGLRVKKIVSFDPITNKTQQKVYTYASLLDACAYKGLNITGSLPIAPLPVLKSSGLGNLVPPVAAPYLQGAVCTTINGGIIGPWNTEVCSNMTSVTSSSIFPSMLYNGSPIAYPSVLESENEDFTKGCIEHKFYSLYTPSLVTMLGLPTNIPEGINESLNGTELYSAVYKFNNNNLTILNEEINEYAADPRGRFSLNNYMTSMRWPLQPGVTSQYNPLEAKLLSMDVGKYNHTAQWTYLQKKTTKAYDENGQNPVESTTEFVYNNLVNYKPSSVKSSTSTTDEFVEKLYKYPNDYTGAPFTDMLAKNILSPVIEEITKKNNQTVSTMQTDYKAWPATIGTFYQPEFVKVSKAEAMPENRLRYYSFDTYGNPTEVSKENDSHISYLWNYKNAFPVAEVKNASVNDIAYTSFEADAMGNWIYDVLGILTDEAITGKKSYTGTLTKTVNAATTYTASLWTKTGATLNGLAGTLLTTKNGWNLYQWTVANTSTVTIVGTNIDEVRLCPSNAFMSTYTFIPFVGISSTSDANNKITYYEYDGSNRLALVRDFDGNVLKKICYNYLGQPEYCKAIEGPSWNLSGQTRCKACDANENYITNILQREFIDVNPQSPSYGLARWEDIPGTNSSCVSAADWQNTNELRCVGYPETPGQQEQEQKDINPCSATAGDTRWILAGINLLDCPEVVPQCNPSNCSGNDKKCIDDVCRTGIKIYTSAVYRKGKWYCTYIYYWAEDGSSSINYSEESTTPCAVS